MTRIAQNELRRVLVNDIMSNKEAVAKYGDQVSTGIAVSLPGDSSDGGIIDGYQQSMLRIQGYQSNITNAQSFLSFQENVLNSYRNLMTRAKELGTQGANGTQTPETRKIMSQEVMQIRDSLVDLANSKYQDKYIYGGANDATPPYTASAGTNYTTPSTGLESQRYLYTSASGSTSVRSVNVTDSLAVTTTTPGSQIFSSGISALEQLGRSLSGYSSTVVGGTPTGAGAAYNFPQDNNLQTQDINTAINAVNSAVSGDLNTELASLAGRERRLDSASNVLTNLQSDGQTVLNKLQKADPTVAASNLAEAQNALQAAYTVSSRVLNLSILDYL